MESNKDLICPICGEPTSVYMGNARKDHLCRTHAKELKDGLLEQCKDCGKFYKSYEKCVCKLRPKKYESLPDLGFKKCLLCAEPTSGYAFCLECYHNNPYDRLLNILNSANIGTDEETLEDNFTSSCLICGNDSNGAVFCPSCYNEFRNAQNNLDKNKKPWELKDHYYNLKAFIVRLKNYDEGITNLYKMYAIASLLEKLYNDSQLSDVVCDDIKKLIKALEKIKNFKPNDSQVQKDKVLVAVADFDDKRASDGHICKSKSEVIVDNYLYNNKICHAYELKVKEIPQSSERAVVADWYIPIEGTTGVYIEYWGMDTKDYQDNKEEKLKLYEKYNVKLISIEKNEINDTQNFEYKMYQELVRLGWKSAQ